MGILERVRKLEENLGFSPSGPELTVVVAIWEQSPGLAPIEPQFAICHDKKFTRLPGEARKDFLDRIVALEQKPGFCLIIWLDEGEEQ